MKTVFNPIPETYYENLRGEYVEIVTNHSLFWVTSRSSRILTVRLHPYFVVSVLLSLGGYDGRRSRQTFEGCSCLL